MLSFEQVKKIILSINNAKTNKVKIPSNISYPEKLKSNYLKTIINTYANSCLEKDIICVIDTTLFKTGKDGFIFTKDKFYGNKYFKHEHGFLNSISYGDIKSIGIDSNNHNVCLIAFKNGKQYRCNNGIYNMYICVILNTIIKEIAKFDEKKEVGEKKSIEIVQQKAQSVEKKELKKEENIKTTPKEEPILKQSSIHESKQLDPYKIRLEYIAEVLKFKKLISKNLDDEELKSLKERLSTFSYFECLEYLYENQFTNYLYLSTDDESISNELHLEQLGNHYYELRTNIILENNKYNNIAYDYAHKSFNCLYQAYLNNRKEVLNDLITSILGLLYYDSINRYRFNNEKALKALKYVESIIEDMKDAASCLNKVLIQKRFSSYYYETNIFQISLLFRDTYNWKTYTDLLKKFTGSISDYYIKGYDAIFELIKHPIFDNDLKNIKKDLFVFGYENRKMSFPLTYSNHMIDINNDQFRNACTYFETEQYDKCYDELFSLISKKEMLGYSYYNAAILLKYNYVENNEDKTFDYFNHAYENGVYEACYHLAKYYEDGDVVEKNETLALKYAHEGVKHNIFTCYNFIIRLDKENGSYFKEIRDQYVTNFLKYKGIIQDEEGVLLEKFIDENITDSNKKEMLSYINELYQCLNIQYKQKKISNNNQLERELQFIQFGTKDKAFKKMHYLLKLGYDRYINSYIEDKDYDDLSVYLFNQAKNSSEIFKENLLKDTCLSCMFSLISYDYGCILILFECIYELYKYYLKDKPVLSKQLLLIVFHMYKHVIDNNSIEDTNMMKLNEIYGKLFYEYSIEKNNIDVASFALKLLKKSIEISYTDETYQMMNHLYETFDFNMDDEMLRLNAENEINEFISDLLNSDNITLEEANLDCLNKDYEFAKEGYESIIQNHYDSNLVGIAHYNLGIMYLQALITGKCDSISALKEFKLAYELGCVEASFMIGYINFEGKNGVAENDEEAFKYFKLAYEHQIMIASYYVGICYLYGYGVDVNEDKANEYKAIYTNYCKSK